VGRKTTTQCPKVVVYNGYKLSSSGLKSAVDDCVVFRWIRTTTCRVTSGRCSSIRPSRTSTTTSVVTSLTRTSRYSTTNDAVYRLVMTCFYAQNLSRTFSQRSINVFVFFTDRALNALTRSFQNFSTFAIVDPTPPMGQPNPWTTVPGPHVQRQA